MLIDASRQVIPRVRHGAQLRVVVVYIFIRMTRKTEGRSGIKAMPNSPERPVRPLAMEPANTPAQFEKRLSRAQAAT